MRRSKPRPVKSTADKLAALIPVLLFFATFAVYDRTSHFGFVNYDDPDYVTANPQVRAGLTAAGVAWAFTHSFAGNWFPITWISHMVDVEFFGLDAGSHHVMSICIHGFAAVLLYLALRRLTGAQWSSAMVAALFALHPLHVESVAWIAERKDVLSAFFFALTLWSYARYVEGGEGKWYASTLAAFALGLMSKPMLVTVPLVLLLLDWWPLRRGFKMREKLPFFALSAAASAIAFVVHREAGATASLAVFPIALRVQNALVSYVIYVLKMFWPSGLAVFYPYSTSLLVPAILCAILLLAITWAAHRRQYLIAGWLWYLVTLAPVIGIVQVGAQARADRYTYIPMIGLSIAVVWGVAEVLRSRPRVLAAIGVSVCVVCSVLTYIQEGYWRDSVTLFRHAVDVTSGNYVAHFNLASALEERGESAGAAAQLDEAVRIKPAFAMARAELGQLLAKQGQTTQALDQLQEAARLSPVDASVHARLGTVLARAGREPEAVAEFQQSLRLNPGDADTHFNLGTALANQGKLTSALEAFSTVVKLKPDDAAARFNLGITLARLGRTPDAVMQISETLRLDPNFPGGREALDALTKR